MAAMVRVWEMPDGTVRITVPVAPQRGGETDAAYIARIGDGAAEKDPSLKTAIIHRDMPKAALSALSRVSGPVGARKQARNAWRFNAAKTAVVVDAAALAALPVRPNL